jgi:uncharacterized membrane protein YeaQ/YmgE (transglycosylase-associated protein family)
MEILWTFIIGIVVGALAKLFMPGRDPGGFIVTALIGIAGSMVAGLMGRALGWYRIDEGPGILASIIGAMLLLVLYRVLFRRRAGVSPHRPV